MGVFPFSTHQAAEKLSSTPPRRRRRLLPWRVRSLSSKVFWPDRASVREALDRLARALLAQEEVLGVYLCGSWAKETHTAASDIDVLIVISGNTEYARLQPRDRIPACLPDRTLSSPVASSLQARTTRNTGLVFIHDTEAFDWGQGFASPNTTLVPLRPCSIRGGTYTQCSCITWLRFLRIRPRNSTPWAPQVPLSPTPPRPA
ncbi:MAG: nucleotidyltransferase domain-containing protein [Bacillota bacterium]